MNSVLIVTLALLGVASCAQAAAVTAPISTALTDFSPLLQCLAGVVKQMLEFAANVPAYCKDIVGEAGNPAMGLAKCVGYAFLGEVFLIGEKLQECLDVVS